MSNVAFLVNMFDTIVSFIIKNFKKLSFIKKTEAINIVSKIVNAG